MNINLGLTAIAGGTVDAITATYAPAVAALTDRLTRFFVATGANTVDNPTFAPNGLTAHPITKKGGQVLALGDIPGAGAVCLVQYNLANTRWELLNPATDAGGETLAQTLLLGNKTGNNDIRSEDDFSILTIADGEATTKWTDGATADSHTVHDALKAFLYYADYVAASGGYVLIDKDVLSLIHNLRLELNAVDVNLVQELPNHALYTDQNNNIKSAYGLFIDTVSTSDNTTATLATINVPTDSVIIIRTEVICRKTGGAGVGTTGEGNVYERSVKATNVAGVVTIGAIQSDWTDEEIADFNATFDVNGINVRVRVTGAINDSVDWKSYTRVKTLEA